jgi:hypothetical protein
MARLPAIIFVSALTLCGCAPTQPQSVTSLSQEASRLNEGFVSVRVSAERLRDSLADVLANPEKFDMPQFPKRVYATYEQSLVYAKEPDGKSTIIATGHVPVDGEVRARLRRLEHLEPLLEKEVKAQSLISMAWAATDESLGVFYPGYDMVALVPPRLDVENDILPYRVATEGNPSFGPVWTEPYVDITGKGYMVTVSVPVAPGRPGGKVEAVAGNDVALEPLVRELAGPGFADRMLLSKDLYVIFAGERLRQALGVESLGQVYYLRQVQKDVPAPEKFRLDRALDPRLRDLGKRLSGLEGEAFLPWGDGTLSLKAARVPETGWLLVEGALR